MDDVEEIVTIIVNIAAAIIGVAIIALILSKRADTANVLQAGGSALANIISAALGNAPGLFKVPQFGLSF